jgi:iron(III) transport system substrate-binding protein
MTITKPAILAVALALAATGVAACGGNDGGGGGADGDELVVYSGRNQDLVGDLFERYQQETGVRLQVRYGNSADLAATLLEEGDNSPADLFFSQDAGALGALQREDRLAQLPQPLLDEVDRRFRSPEGRWLGVTARARVIAYDRRELGEGELPGSVLDLTGERWSGRVGWAPTNASFESFVTALRRLRGDEAAREWLEGMVANDARAFENNIAVRDAIARGEVDVGLINHYYVAEAIAEEGGDYPVAMHFPPGGDPGSLVNVAGVGILDSSERQEQARRLAEFMLSRTGQEYFAGETKEYPLAAGVRPGADLPPLEQIEQPDIDLGDLADLPRTVEMIREAGAL